MIDIGIEQTETLVNENLVKYKMMSKLEDLLLGFGFIIFGGYVRDKMIHDYYSKKFYNRPCGNQFFSDKNVHPKLKGRLVIPKDIDCFLNETYEETTKRLLGLNDQGFDLDFAFGDKQYPLFENVDFFRVKVRLSNARMYGLRHISVHLDVTCGTKPQWEPPYGKLDMLCNSFILTSNGIRLSNNTGTYIDELGAVSKKLLENKIIKNILLFKTKVADAMLEPGFRKDEMGRMLIIPPEILESEMEKILTEEGFCRILKMVNRGWSVSVLPQLGDMNHRFSGDENHVSPEDDEC